MAFDKKSGAGKMCLSVKNIGEAGGCPQNITGVRFKLYAANEIDVDNSFTVESVKGAGIANAHECGGKGDGSVTLFQGKCNSNNDLGMEDRWDFIDAGKDCKLPPSDVQPGEHFVFKEIKWPAAPPFRRKLDMTVFFECNGTCSGSESSKTFKLIVP